MHRVARGYYLVVPQDRVGRPWLPGLEAEAAAAGIAAEIYGADRSIVMGVSAARLLGAIPRALAIAVVAVPNQHWPIELLDRAATVHFVKRDTDALDAERVETPTVLDLARRPQLGNAEAEAPSAINSLYRRSDLVRLTRLAEVQRLSATLRRVEVSVGALDQKGRPIGSWPLD